MSYPAELKYTKEHEWIRINGDGTATIGITEFAQGELGEIVYVEVDTVGEILSKDEVFGTIEAVKTTSDLFMPVTGEIIEFNEAISEKGGDNPTLINNDPYGEGWLIKVKVSDVSEIDELLDAESYQATLA